MNKGIRYGGPELKSAIKIYLTTTDKMMADIMTKPTDKTTFLRCCAYISTDGHVD